MGPMTLTPPIARPSPLGEAQRAHFTTHDGTSSFVRERVLPISGLSHTHGPEIGTAHNARIRSQLIPSGLVTSGHKYRGASLLTALVPSIHVPVLHHIRPSGNSRLRGGLGPHYNAPPTPSLHHSDVPSCSVSRTLTASPSHLTPTGPKETPSESKARTLALIPCTLVRLISLSDGRTTAPLLHIPQNSKRGALLAP